MNDRKIALITGASSGIGLAAAQRLAQTHRLILVARGEERLRAAAAALPADTELLAVDITDSEALRKAVAALGLSRLDALVHSAGLDAIGRVADTDPQEWQRVLALNVTAPAYLTSLLLPALREAHGTVVFINSGAGLRAIPNFPLYCASKHALRAVTECLRGEEQGRVRVSNIAPGRVDTPMQERLQASLGNPYRAEEHLRPESVAESIALAVLLGPDANVHEIALGPAGLN
ncbi:SDR family oxidoreductase [Dermabacteraceae bacterium P7074]